MDNMLRQTRYYTTNKINHVKMNEIYKNENIHVQESKIIIQQEVGKRINRCNQHPIIQRHVERGIHWSTNQMSHFPQLEFKFDPLNIPQWSCHFVDPAFCSMCSHSMAWLAFLFYLVKFWFFFKKTWIRHLFLFYFF